LQNIRRIAALCLTLGHQRGNNPRNNRRTP